MPSGAPVRDSHLSHLRTTEIGSRGLPSEYRRQAVGQDRLLGAAPRLFEADKAHPCRGLHACLSRGVFDLGLLGFSAAHLDMSLPLVFVSDGRAAHLDLVLGF